MGEGHTYRLVDEERLVPHGGRRRVVAGRTNGTPRPRRVGRALELSLGVPLLRKVLVAAAGVTVRNLLRAVRRLHGGRAHQTLGCVRQVWTGPCQKESQRLVLVLKVVVHDPRNRKVAHVASEVLRVVVIVANRLTPLVVALGARVAARRRPVGRRGQKLVAGPSVIVVVLVVACHGVVENVAVRTAS
eukprot:271258-Prymnesium_polylepis.1